LEINDIDTYFVRATAEHGWNRISVSTVAGNLRQFFKYAETKGLVRKGFAALIAGPRIYAFEGLPLGPSWQDVQRLLTSLDLKRPKDIRDRPILMLCAIYGLRCSEVSRLRLEDIDWERDILNVSHAKGGGPGTHPLLPSVGNAILTYLQTVRPPSNERTVFLTLQRPYRPLSRVAIYEMVSDRLKSLGVKLPHYGPHSLRHACATHLLNEGESMKAIGDQLAHRSVASTSIYAKVDMPHLREIAAFDLGELM
jgi:integrase